MQALILGRGNMGRALRDALAARGDGTVGPFGRPERDPRPNPAGLGRPDVAFEFTAGEAVAANVAYATAAGCRALVIGTTGWTADHAAAAEVAGTIERAGARAIVAPTFSLGAILFGLLAEEAARLFGRFPAYDPYLFEHHRAAKADRPSGTALALADRILPYLEAKRRARPADGSGAPDAATLEVVALRAGASPGLHVLGFDAPGESVELRVTARDRSAYVAGALVAADRLLAAPAPAWTGVRSFESIVRDLLADREDSDALVA